MKKNRVKRLLSLILAFSFAVGAAALPAEADSTGTPIRGIDVSTFNKTIDWTQVKNAGVQFAMIRDGYGGTPGMWDSQKDAFFEKNYSGATAAGIKVGVYHYSYATTAQMAANEADECLYILNGRHLDYPVAYDVEDKCQSGLSRETLGQIVETFCTKIAAAGYTPIVYSYKNFFLGHLDSTPVYSYDAWVAQYDASAPDFSLYTMWQYTSSGSVPGISGSVDMDYSYVDYSSNGVGTHGIDRLTFKSDTSSYTFGNNSTYVYKISTLDTFPPTATSSNPSAVTVSAATPTYRGFLFTLKNVGAGTATITTTAGDGRSVSFQATGTGTAVASLVCDTPAYTFRPGSGVYSYKITTDASTAPIAVSSNPSAVTVAYSKSVPGGYLYKITNVGAGTATITTTAADGASVSFQATGVANANASASSSASVAADGMTALKSDTPFNLSMKKGAYYTYKFTGSPNVAYQFSCAGTNVIRSASLTKKDGSYYLKIYAVGTGSAGIYASGGGKSQRVGVVTVSGGTENHAITTLQSDTPYYFNMAKGAYYTYKFTGDPSVSYQFVCAGTNVIRTASLTKKNGSYYLKIYAMGKGSAGIYASGGKSQQVGVVTVQ